MKSEGGLILSLPYGKNGVLNPTGVGGTRTEIIP